MSVQSFETTKVQVLGFPLGSPKKSDIWLWSLRRGIECTIGKGVVFPFKGYKLCEAYA